MSTQLACKTNSPLCRSRAHNTGPKSTVRRTASSTSGRGLITISRPFWIKNLPTSGIPPTIFVPPSCCVAIASLTSPNRTITSGSDSLSINSGSGNSQAMHKL